jgi:hypothetical protein
MKKLLVVALAIMIASSAAMATDTRISSIGAASTFLTDYTDIYMLPSVLTAYPRWINAELGTFPTTAYNPKGSASITFTNNTEQTWGVIGLDLNHAIYGEQAFREDLTWINGWIGSAILPMPDNKFHLFYAKKFGGLTAGLHVARAAGSLTEDYTDSTRTMKGEATSGLWNINAGISLAPKTNITVDAAVAFQMLSFKGDSSHTVVTPASSGSTTIESDGGSNIMFGARAFYGMSDELKIVPAIGFNMYSLGYKTSYSGTDTLGNAAEGGKKSSTNFTGEIGLNYMPVENVTLVGGLHVGFGSSTIEDTNAVFGVGAKKETISGMVLPGFSAGVEAKLLKWLDLRFGASKMLTSSTTKLEGHTGGTGNYTSETKSTTSSYAFNCGLGLTFGKLTIDAKVNDDQPFSLGYLMSGNTVERVPFTMVSATYKF